jgi:hypothetical protein
MQIGKIVSALATTVLIAALAAGSNVLLDRFDFAATGPRAAATAPPGTPCMDEDGRWVNWPWPNAPALTLPCAPGEKIRSESASK